MNTNKKVYTKPEISFVNFELSTSIAGDCKYQSNLSDNNCEMVPVIGENGWITFSDPLKGCNDFVGDDQLCYHVPSVDSSVFTS